MTLYYTPPARPVDEADVDDVDLVDRWYHFDEYWLDTRQWNGRPACSFILTFVINCWLWNGRARGIQLINARRLLQRKTPMPEFCYHESVDCFNGPPVTLDSGGFEELRMFGRFTIKPSRYVALAREVDARGDLRWAACQDHMVEADALAATGKSVEYHQRATIDSFCELVALAPDIRWMPVLQGRTAREYLDHLHMYSRAGVELRTIETVGVGSVCRRHNTEEISMILSALEGHALRLHAFGVKSEGLDRNAGRIVSSDSAAWSENGRKQRARDEEGHWLQNSQLHAERFRARMDERAAKGRSAPFTRPLFDLGPDQPPPRAVRKPPPEHVIGAVVKAPVQEDMFK